MLQLSPVNYYNGYGSQEYVNFFYIDFFSFLLLFLLRALRLSSAPHGLPIPNHLELRICLIQLDIKENLSATLNNLSTLIERAVSEHRPRVIALPEAFGFNYESNPSIFKAAAETIPDGESCRFLSEMANKHAIYIVGGTIIERRNDKLYNTCTIWNPNGELIARHSKVCRENSVYLSLSVSNSCAASKSTICSYLCSCVLGSFV